METGTQVIYYRHEQSDDQHWAVDSLAFVIQDLGDNGVELVVFPVGGPTQYVRAKQYDPDVGSKPGQHWFRPIDEAAPDLAPPAEAEEETEEETDDDA